MLHVIYTYGYMTNYIVHYMNNYRVLYNILHGITCCSMEFVLVPTSWTRLRRQDLRLPPPQGVPTHPLRRRRRLGHVRRRRRAGRRPEAPPLPPPAGGGSGVRQANNRQSQGPAPAGRAAEGTAGRRTAPLPSSDVFVRAPGGAACGPARLSRLECNSFQV